MLPLPASSIEARADDSSSDDNEEDEQGDSSSSSKRDLSIAIEASLEHASNTFSSDKQELSAMVSMTAPPRALSWRSRQSYVNSSRAAGRMTPKATSSDVLSESAYADAAPAPFPSAHNGTSATSSALYVAMIDAGTGSHWLVATGAQESSEAAPSSPAVQSLYEATEREVGATAADVPPAANKQIPIKAKKPNWKDAVRERKDSGHAEVPQESAAASQVQETRPAQQPIHKQLGRAGELMVSHL